MASLADLLGWMDNKRRVVGRNLSDLINDPANALEKTADNTLQTVKELPDDPANFLGVGTFIGKGAKTWDAVSMGRAQKMAEQGADPRAIWKETGTWQGPDGAWRQEIPDNSAQLESGGKFFGLNGGGGSVSQVLEHQNLINAYPEVGGISASFRFGDRVKNHSGSFDEAAKHISVDAPLGFNAAKDTVLHEIQHVIQNREGWARGGNPSNIVEILKDIASKKQKEAGEYAQKAYSGDPLNLSDLRKPGMLKRGLAASKEGQDMKALAQRVYDFPELEHHTYQRLAGEAEARATQARMNMDAAQRRNVFPADSYDVPIDQLIIRDGNGMRSLKDLIPK